MLLREIRNEKGLTISALSVATEIHIKRLKVIERGLDKPSTKELETIGEYFDLTEIDLKSITKSATKKGKTIGEGYVTAIPANFLAQPPIEQKQTNNIPVLDLFSGIGGISYGFEQTGHFETIGGLDLLSDRINSFQLNHPHAFGFTYDITQFKPSKIEKYFSKNPTIIVGGAPCQGFSSIRPFRTLTENDKRNNLFQSFARYIEYFNPEWFVFENVVGLLSHQNGDALNVLLNEFKKLGYDVDFRVLNSAFYGVPQMRERLIVVGNRVGVKFQFPQPTHYVKHKSMAGNNNSFLLTPNEQECVPALSVMEALSDLPVLKSGESIKAYSENTNLTAYQKYLRFGSNILNNHDSSVHSEKMMEIIKCSGYNIEAVRHLVTSGFSTCYSRLEPNKPSVTLTVNFVSPSSNKCIHPYQDRALTPREGARIQGFPDTFNFYGTRTQIVKQIGNAVPPILSKVIAEKIFSYY
jgi:DNA (cytosine-5)-methyltransferase 1